VTATAGERGTSPPSPPPAGGGGKTKKDRASTGGRESNTSPTPGPGPPLAPLSPSAPAALFSAFPSSAAAPPAPRPAPRAGAAAVVIEYQLASEMIGDRPAFQAVFGKELVPRFAVTRFFQGLLHVEVISPAGQLNSVIAPLASLFADDFQRKIGPLAGEQCG